MTGCDTLTRTRQRAALVAGPEHASKREQFCHTHVHASRLVNKVVDRGRVGGSRFLEVDPIEGGSSNDYDYVNGDPINNLDLAGTYCLTGKNKNGSCRSISRGSGRVARTTYRHVNVSTGLCAFVCGNVGFQGGHVYAGWTAIGFSTPGVNVGWANKEFKDRQKYSIGAGGGLGWGGYGSVGSDGQHAHTDDWEVGGMYRPGGFFLGVSRNYEIFRF